MRLYYIEPLESRIAPASIFTYMDADGDHVKIMSSSGDLAGHVDIVGGQLEKLDLTDAMFEGASIKFIVTKSPGGDGLANVGAIDATGRNLGSITILGDLGHLDAGNSLSPSVAVAKLSVNSMGNYGLSTQGPGGDLDSHLYGSLNSLLVATDVNGASINVLGGPSAKLGSVTIGGSLVGGSNSFSGSLDSTGGVGTVKIGGSVIGGTATGSGGIRSWSNIGKIKIGGSLLGGNASSTGEIAAGHALGTVKIGGDVVGGNATGSASVNETGYITANTIASIIIKGSLISGDNTGTGTLAKSGSIQATATMGAVKIGGDVVGNDTTPVVISAQGVVVTPQTADVDIALSKLSIAGSVQNAQVLAGYDTSLNLVDGNAQIGTLQIGGNVTGSSVMAGLLDVNNLGVGNADDTLGLPSLVSRIASIQAAGLVLGTGADNTLPLAEIGNLNVPGIAPLSSPFGVAPLISPSGIAPLTSALGNALDLFISNAPTLRSVGGS